MLRLLDRASPAVVVLLIAAGTLLSADGLDRLTHLRIRGLSAQLREAGTSPIPHGFRMEGFAAERHGEPAALAWVLVDGTTARERSGICGLWHESAEQQRSGGAMRWLTVSGSSPTCGEAALPAARVASLAGATATSLPHDARWWITDEGGRVVYSRRDIPTAALVDSLLAIATTSMAAAARAIPR